MHPESLKTTLITALFTISFAFLAGCGGGGGSNPVSVNPARSLEMTVAPVADEPLLIIELKNLVAAAPDSAFIGTVDSLNPGQDPRRHEDKLVKTLEAAMEAIENDQFSDAAWILRKQFVPRVDGCSGGHPVENDLIGDCTVAMALYSGSMDIIETIETVVGSDRGKKTRTRGAGFIDLEAFKDGLVEKTNNLISTIFNAPDTTFIEPDGDTRQTLLYILDYAEAMIIAGSLENARYFLKDGFLPLVDGGADGDPADDLLSAWYYSTPEYSDIMKIVLRLTDTTPPVVQIIYPVADAIANPVRVYLEALATDNIEVASVEFILAGVPLGPAVYNSGDSYIFDYYLSRLRGQDGVTLTAIATDTSGNTSSTTITFDVRTKERKILSVNFENISRPGAVDIAPGELFNVAVVTSNKDSTNLEIEIGDADRLSTRFLPPGENPFFEYTFVSLKRNNVTGAYNLKGIFVSGATGDGQLATSVSAAATLGNFAFAILAPQSLEIVSVPPVSIASGN